MKEILILGAGRSSSSLIQYLINEGQKNNWCITVGDYNEKAARESLGTSTLAKSILFDISNEEKSSIAIAQADVVISLMPAMHHPKAARLCLKHNKHFLTASYVSEEMQSFHAEASAKNLLFLNECGLDPGIDHMSAMQVIDKIKENDGNIISFESFTGGLIATETDVDNPWRYKFTWNPRNVVTAGQSTAKFLQDTQYKYIPYQQLFSRTTPVHVHDYGNFEGYANRDSLKYINTYGLQHISTMIRGTLRHEGFCSAWNLFVQLGCCDDTYLMDNVPSLTHHEFINAFLPHDAIRSVEQKLADQFKLKLSGTEIQKLKWSGFFDDELVGLAQGTPAQILEHILHKKWKLQPTDKDMIVMWHRFVFKQGDGSKKEIHATCIAKGDDAINTAMAKTVGLPLAIATKLLLQNKIKQRGIAIPTAKEFYEPILSELKLLGIELTEREVRVME